ncbi:late embryogenesis abundant protein D-34-like [Impatiens glandulifera]|uniref:late embryogenesis abundant protein D-34-like n=1 Tax=Impatiens glandulifera TaxID=253017 RepID=UPI001FB108F0|nr:late embryogenesis abundant protein D-34-like [Impatiens glandulifera]
MSQEQPHRPDEKEEAVKYDLSDELIKPQDAAMMQAAETCVFSRNQKGFPASAMQAAATTNERIGVEDVTDSLEAEGVTVTSRVITQSVAGEVVGQYYQSTSSQEEVAGPITIGEALELTTQIAGNKPVEKSDAAAIHEAEARATGRNIMKPGGVSATAQSAAAYNAGVTCEDDKIKLSAVLRAVTRRLSVDKAATREDAEEVVMAELKNNPNSTTHPGGVGSSLAAAARMNEGKMDNP